jgi:hypothetical protein
MAGLGAFCDLGHRCRWRDRRGRLPQAAKIMKKRPNKTPEPTRGAVLLRAGARSASSRWLILDVRRCGPARRGPGC